MTGEGRMAAPKPNPGPRRWESTAYHLLTVAPVAGLLSVWAEDRPDGSCRLYATRCLAIGVEEVVTTLWEAGSPARKVESYEPRREVVHLDLSDGFWHVCEEAENFAGGCPEGEDIYRATGCLRGEHLVRLVRPDGSPVR